MTHNCEKLLEELLGAALALSGKGSAAALLRTAAALTERAGYEAARNESRASVTRMMLLSAELEGLATTLTSPVDGENPSADARLSKAKQEPAAKVRGNGYAR